MPPPSGVNNLFSLLADDEEADDGFTVVQQKQPKENKKVSQHKEADEAPKNQPARERKGKSERPPRAGKGNRREAESYDGTEKPVKPQDSEGRKGGKGDRRERRDGEKGERRSKGKGDRRGREFDRHQSGNGRGKGEETREGRGKWNWGDKTDGAEPAADGDADTENKPPREREEATNEVHQEVEEEDEEETISFEDYMKAQASKTNVGPKLEERKIDAFEGPAGFKTTRDKDDGGDDALYGMAFHEYSGKNKAQADKEAREGWVQDVNSVLSVKFVDPNQAGGRDDRRGKGGKKGGKGRDDSRGGRGPGRQARPQSQSAGGQGKFELEDTKAFPSLA